MRNLKMLGLAAIAAAALTALVGVGSASATTLCEQNVTTGCTKHVAKETTIDFSAEDSIKLAGPLGIVLDTCTISTTNGPTTSTGSDEAGGVEGANVTGAITTLTFEGCSRKTTVTSTGTFKTASGAEDPTFGTLSITHIKGTDNGKVFSSGATVTIHELPNIVGNPATCAYITNNTELGTLTGSTTTPTFDISATITSETENCPSGTWSGHYKYTGTTPFTISD